MRIWDRIHPGARHTRLALMRSCRSYFLCEAGIAKDTTGRGGVDAAEALKRVLGPSSKGSRPFHSLASYPANNKLLNWSHRVIAPGRGARCTRAFASLHRPSARRAGYSGASSPRFSLRKMRALVLPASEAASRVRELRGDAQPGRGPNRGALRPATRPALSTVPKTRAAHPWPHE